MFCYEPLKLRLTRIRLCSLASTATALKYVAIKASSCQTTVLHVRHRLWEREVLRSIANADPTHPGYKYCTPLRELFLTNTVHGTHVNFVTGVLGPNLNQLYHRFPRGPARTVVAKRITKQVLLALSYLHGPCQSIHTGERSF